MTKRPEYVKGEERVWKDPLGSDLAANDFMRPDRRIWMWSGSMTSGSRLLAVLAGVILSPLHPTPVMLDSSGRVEKEEW
jgi:hypothetical protein